MLRPFTLILTTLAASFLLALPAAATTITFEGLPDYSHPPDGYGGLNWNADFLVLNGTTYATSGYKNGRVSGDMVGLNGWTSPVELTAPSGKFTFVSGYFTGAWNNDLSVQLVGSLAGTTLYDRTIVVSTTSPTLFTFNYSGIDKLRITTSGGTSAGYGGGGTHVAMDDLVIAFNVCPNGVPEPGEDCDDGAALGGDGCSSQCLLETGYFCAGTPSTCAPLCGDGLLVAPETCDDGNASDGDGCSSACGTETGFSCGGAPSSCTGICGDSLIVGTESCDDGDASPGDGCSDTCNQEPGWTCSGAPSSCASTCGDGIPVGAEDCDDGDLVDGDGCTASCDIEPTFLCSGVPSTCLTDCGNATIDVGEDCDDGARVGNDGCSAVCTLEGGWDCTGTPSSCQPICGDGLVIGSEECDDFNANPDDCCSGSCSFEPGASDCHAGASGVSNTSWFSGPFQHLTAGWAFDVRADVEVVAVGVPDCGASGLDEDHLVAIWDATLQQMLNVTVPSGAGAELSGTVRYVPVPNVLLEAGHRYVIGAMYMQGGTECVVNVAAASIDPRLTYVSGRETYSTLGLSYPSAPSAPRFGATFLVESDRGNGVLDLDEDCDDANVDDGDGCSANGVQETGYACQGEPSACSAICSDGLVVGDETCDEGNATAGDGCSDACQIEPGYTCQGIPSACTNSCGDGAVDVGEVCDDGNLDTDDGCTATCAIEPSYFCAGEPSLCTTSCGDGIIDIEQNFQEQCDDGNLLDGDCCSAHCEFEPTSLACHASLSNPSGGGGSGGVNVVEGWEFTVSEPLTVSALGVYDEPSAAGLAEPHEVAIWDSMQQIIATGTVPAGISATSVGALRYVPIPAVTLQPGENYTIGALFPTPRYDTVLGTLSFTLDPRVSVVTGRRLPFVGGLVYPSTTDPNVRIGPAFLLSLAECGDGDIDGDETCDDGNLEPTDGCSEECVAFCPNSPRTGCRASEVSSVRVKDDSDDSRDMLLWKWLKGEQVSATELTDPTTTGLYLMCLYPDTALSATVVLPQGVLWSSEEEKGYAYSDKSGTVGGISSLKIRTAGSGRTSVKLKAMGATVPDSLLPVTSYAVQLVDAMSGVCWSSEFASGLLKDNVYKAKAP